MRTIFGWNTCLFCWLACLLSGCVVVPPRDGLAQVHIEDVVKRIKCDIGRAVLQKTNQRSAAGKYPFAFLLGWAAKLHLTIIVDNTASINPGATLIQALPSVKSTSQSYSTGIGIGLSTEAIRTEDVEFLMSFSDMSEEFHHRARGDLYNFCELGNGLFLESDLGLSALVDSALRPVETGVLYPGKNIGPGAAPPATPQKELITPAGQLSAIGGVQKQLTELKDLKGKDTEKAQLAQMAKDVAADVEKRTQAVINNIVKPLYGIVSTSSLASTCLPEITNDQNKAIVMSIGVSENVIKVDQNANDLGLQADALEAVKRDFIGVIDWTNKMITSYEKCAKEVNKIKPKVYDPIDAIGETVNFYITSSGSITPTWKLVQVTAPLAATFASASRKDTNTLILSMGRPVLAPDGTLAASSAMNNQILASLLNQSLSQRPLQPF